MEPDTLAHGRTMFDATKNTFCFPFHHFKYLNCPRLCLFVTNFEETPILTLLKMTSLYNTVGWKTSSMQDLKDQTKKLQCESDLRKLQNTIRDSISEGIRAQTLKEGISLKIENEDGQVYIPLAPSPTN